MFAYISLDLVTRLICCSPLWTWVCYPTLALDLVA